MFSGERKPFRFLLRHESYDSTKFSRFCDRLFKRGKQVNFYAFAFFRKNGALFLFQAACRLSLLTGFPNKVVVFSQSFETAETLFACLWNAVE